MKHANTRDINLFVARVVSRISSIHISVDLVTRERSREEKEIPRQTNFLVLPFLTVLLRLVRLRDWPFSRAGSILSLVIAFPWLINWCLHAKNATGFIDLYKSGGLKCTLL